MWKYGWMHGWIDGWTDRQQVVRQLNEMTHTKHLAQSKCLINVNSYYLCLAQVFDV